MKLNQKRTAILTAAVLLGSVTALAIPGIPDLVIDLIQEANSGRQLIQDAQMLANLVQQAQMAKANMLAFPARLKTSFQGATQQLYRPSTGNLFGETGTLGSVISNANSSYGAVKSGWDSSGVVLHPTSLFQNHLVNSSGLNNLAHVEISDAAGINALQTVNSVRSQQPTNENAIKSLQQSCLDGTNDTAAMQANCAAASGILNAQTGQATNALLAAVVDVSTAQLKTERDREARRVNSESRVREYQATEATSVKLDPDHWRNFNFNFGGNQ